jgi:membrane associated rhomboid family serine protease
MSVQAPVAYDVEGETPVDLAVAGVYATSEEAFDHGLVVLAMGQSCWLVPMIGGHRLLVEPNVLEPARVQLTRYDRESRHWPPRPIPIPATSGIDLVTPLLWAFAVLVAFNLQGERPNWVASGALDAAALFDRGEWWRVGTALFLHADAGHVVSNALSGLLVFAAVVQTLGRLRGWLLIVSAALVGNLAVAAVNYPVPYHSLGASTAIFGGVGVLTGRALRVVARSGHPHRRRELFVALASGLVVVALYGVGGVEVDLGAHVMGFVAGLALGFASSVETNDRPRSSAHRD